MLQDEEFLQKSPLAPSPGSTVTDNIILFHASSCFPLNASHHHQPSVRPWLGGRSEDTISDMYMIRVSALLCVVPLEQGGPVGFRTGSTASTAWRRAVPGSRSVPRCQTQSRLSLSPGGVWKGSRMRCHLQAVSQWASLHWGVECVLCEKKR